MPDDVRSFGDALEPELRRAFLAAVAQASTVVPLDTVASWIRQGDLASIRALAEQLVARGLIESSDRFVQAVIRIVSDAGTAVAATFQASFTIRHPRAETWIRRHAATLISAISADTVQAVREILEAGYAAGIGPDAMAKQIQAVVGLLPAHAAAVRRYTQTLVDAGVDPDRISELSDLYTDRLRLWRANMIARTETMQAAHRGQMEGWMQAADQRLLDVDRAWLEWVVTDDDRLCPLCAPLDGARVRFGEQFVATHKGFPDGKPEARGARPVRRKLKPDPWSKQKIGKADEELTPLVRPIVVDHPPLHPQCRCTVRLRFDPIGTPSGTPAG